MSAPASQDRVRVVVVAGPTAAGKTALGIAWAEKWGGEIVGADSQQVYRYMDVGTAKPSAEERLRVVHHMIDVVDPDDAYSAGRYETEASAAIDAIWPIFMAAPLSSPRVSTMRSAFLTRFSVVRICFAVSERAKSMARETATEVPTRPTRPPTCPAVCCRADSPTRSSRIK